MSGREVGVQESVALDAPQEASVTSLVEMAIREKVPVEILERLVALQERVTERNARTAFVEAMTAFAQECPPIKKTRENSQFKVSRAGTQVAARYAPLEEISNTARPVAAKHGLYWKWNTTVDEKFIHITCRITHVDGHFEETVVSMPYESKAGASPQQKFAIAQTYGMRYSLVAALGITTADDDADGNAPGEPPEPLSDEQLADLSALLEEVDADRTKFLRWMAVESLEDIPQSDYARAVKALEAKRGAR